MSSNLQKHTDVSAIGIDIGKNTFHLIGQDRRGKIIMRARVSRAQLMERLVNVPKCLIGMEAGAGAHHIARRLIEMGHEVRLIPAQYVKPFLKGHKNDYRDAEAIIEAVQRPTMSFVAVKTAEQCDLQALHRVRSRIVRLRTGAINQIRGLLLECGVVIGQRTAPLRKALPVILDPPKHLSPRVLRLIMALIDELNMLEARIEALTDEIEALAAEDDACQRLMSVPVSASSSRAPSSPRLALAAPSSKAGISPPGLVWCRGRCLQAAAPSSPGSRSAATATCDISLFRRPTSFS